MKNILIKLTLILAIGLINNAAFAQQKKVETTTFWVAGVCGMCEETIEKTLDTKGVVQAGYVLATNQLTVTYKTKKINLDQIHHLLNEAGYDTEKSICSDEQYGRVHGCCKYRELDKH
jgi:copper chaperone CopZ